MGPTLLRLQIGVDISGQAAQRAARKLATACKQSQDPLSGPLQQLGGLGVGSEASQSAAQSKTLPAWQIIHGDIATAAAQQPGENARCRPFSSLYVDLCSKTGPWSAAIAHSCDLASTARQRICLLAPAVVVSASWQQVLLSTCLRCSLNLSCLCSPSR